MSYRLVRVNTRDHTTRDLAFDDLVSIIERGFYWKQSQLPDIRSGTQMIGMGSHGGQGLFIVGVTTTDEWEDEPDDDVYRHRLPVAWARVVYENRSMLGEIKSISSRFNERFGAELTQEEYREIITLVLSADGLDMYADSAPA